MIVNTLVRAIKKSGVHPRDPALASLYALPATKAGVSVTEDTALTLGSVWACVRVLSESVASLPLPVLSDDSGGKTSKAKTHPMWRIAHDRPNKSMSSFMFRETMQGQASLTGNAVARIERVKSGAGAALHPYRTQDVRMDEDAFGNVIYELHTMRESNIVIAESDVVHIRGFSPDGMWGYSPVRLMREMLALGIATEQYGGSVFGSRSMPGGHYEVPHVMEDDEFDNFKKKIGAFAGPDGWNKSMVLENGIKFVADTMSPEDSQFILTRAHNAKDVARIWRVPPHMIGVLDDATYSNIEQESLNFVIHTLRPWLVRWEQELNEKLFVPSQRGKFYIEFNVDGLLRGDAKARAEANKIKFMHGALNLDEWRAQDNDNPLPDGLGQRHFVPVNLQALDKIDDEPEPAPIPAQLQPDDGEDQNDDDNADDSQDNEDDGEGDDSRSKIAAANAAIWETLSDQLLAKEAKQLRQACRKRSGAEFLDWLDEFYTDHAGGVVKLLGPVLRTFGGEGADAYVQQFADRYSRVAVTELSKIAGASADVAALQQAAEDWIVKRRCELVGTEYNDAVAALVEN